MNFGQLKYAIEVADTGSFSKAAERLYISQPNLSRAIRELETSLGTTLFERSTKGTELTPDGEIFIRYAKSILQQLNDVETMFTDPSAGAKHFSISAPRASYAAEAFGKFSAMLSAFPGEVEAFYRETDSRSTIDGVMQDEYRLGMIRYPATYDKHFKSMLDDKKLTYELIAEFDYIILTSENSPLAKLPEISYEDLEPLTEISYPDPYLPSIPMSAIRNGGRTAQPPYIRNREGKSV